MFVAALFMTDKKYKQPKCPPTDEMDIQIWYSHSMQFYLVLQKERSTDTCYNVHG